MSTASLQKLMKEFFATHSYNREDDWRETPETDADPVDDGDVVWLKDWDPAQHPRVPSGSGDPSGEFTSVEDGVTEQEKPKKPRVAWTVIGSGDKVQPQVYARAMEAARNELDNLGMQGQKLEFTFGPGVPISELADVSNSTEAARFTAPSRGRPADSGIISVNLDQVIEGDKRGAVVNIVPIIRHEVSHARYCFADRKSQRPASFLEKNMDALRKEDGTTNYSKAWWARAERADRLDSWSASRSAVKESLAEMSRLKAFSPTYGKLNSIVDDVWGKKHKGVVVSATLRKASSTQTDGTGALLELPDGVVAAFLNKDLELTTKDKAAFVRVVYTDGSSTTGVVETAADPVDDGEVVQLKATDAEGHGDVCR